MKNKLLIIAITCFINVFGYSQYNQLIDYGKPLLMSNAISLGCIIPADASITDYTTILIDKGELSTANNVLPANCFKVVFVTLLSKKVQVIDVKDLQGNVITEAIGDPFGWVYGGDGNIYLCTQGGGHLVKINYWLKTATDLGKPIGFSGMPNLTTLSLGTDLTLHGIINNLVGTTQGPYSFRYAYNGVFSDIDTTVIDPLRSRAKQIGADKDYTYVRCEASDYVLYAINNTTKEKKIIQLMYNDGPLDPSKPFEIETYIGDYVYARISDSGKAYYWRLYNGQVIDNLQPNPYIKVRGDLVWKQIHNIDENNIYTSWNSVSSILYYKINNTTGSIDLSNYVMKIGKQTGPLTIYYNASKGRNELLVTGSKYSASASLNYNGNNDYTILGANNMLSVASSTTDFDSSIVLIGSYSNGTIQSYNSNKNWNIFSDLSSPSFTSASANPLIKYQLQNPANSLNNIPGPILVAALQKINKSHLYVAGGGRARNNPPYYVDEMCVSIINPATNQFSNIYSQTDFGEYTFGAMGIDQENGRIIAIGLKREMPNKNSCKLFILDTNGTLIYPAQELFYNGERIFNLIHIEVINKKIFIYSGNYLLRINDYSLPNTSIELMYDITITGCFYTMGIGKLINGTPFLAAAYIPRNSLDLKLVYMPLTTTHNIFPGADPDVIKIDGTINEGLGYRPCEFAFANGKAFLSGYTSIYGFNTIPSFNRYSNKPNNIKLLFPNPAKTHLNIKYYSPKDEAIQVQLLDNKGLALLSTKYYALSGINDIILNISNLNTGSFIVKIDGKTEDSSSIFIKE